MIRKAREILIIALDVNNLNRFAELTVMLKSYVDCFKVGAIPLTAIGAPRSTNFIHQFKRDSFLDSKFGDTPNTVGEATKVAAKLGVKFITVHASAGIEAMKAAVANKGKSKIIAVTVLTSLGDDHLNKRNRPRYIFGAASKKKVLQFARDAKRAGCDGIVCSVQELEFLKSYRTLHGLIKMALGIRDADAPPDDQSRTGTVTEAIDAGADYVVVGRPIIAAKREMKVKKDVGGPVGATKRILKEITIATRRRK